MKVFVLGLYTSSRIATIFDVFKNYDRVLKDEGKARAVQQLEDALHRKPEEVIVEEKRTVPVFIEPLSAPVSCEEGDRVHFSARYEPVNDNQLQVSQFHAKIDNCFRVNRLAIK